MRFTQYYYLALPCNKFMQHGQAMLEISEGVLAIFHKLGAFYIGCWRVDPSNMTITSVGDFRGVASDQLEIVRRCADIAAANSFSVFAMFNQTKCLTDDSAYRTFSSLGVSKNCGISSMGGTDAISVYTYEKRKIFSQSSKNHWCI